eukprot:6067506-Alexandrium_andersonii.AAC.1
MRFRARVAGGSSVPSPRARRPRPSRLRGLRADAGGRVDLEELLDAARWNERAGGREHPSVGQSPMRSTRARLVRR